MYPPVVHCFAYLRSEFLLGQGSGLQDSPYFMRAAKLSSQPVANRPLEHRFPSKTTVPPSYR